MWDSRRIAIPSKIGVFLVTCAIICIIVRPQDSLLDMILDKELPLIDASKGMSIWKDVDIEFRVYIFHVENFKEVQETGAVAKLIQRGPYVYDEHMRKRIISVNESEDTLEYKVAKKLVFNATKSGKFSDEDELTIVNVAYTGIILTIAESFGAFLGQFGNNIRLMFPDPKSIFVRGKVKDILFDGLPLACDPKVHPSLSLICSVLKTNRPPILRTTPESGVYAYSFFHKLNHTEKGPYVVNRGSKDRFLTGKLHRAMGLPYSDVWYEKNCSLIEGGDGIFGPPLASVVPRLLSYISDVCRSFPIFYKDDVVLQGLLGHRYVSTELFWEGVNQSSCFCPKAPNQSLLCHPAGFLDITKCQKVPILVSEPHFLHCSDDLFSIVEGLESDEEVHRTYAVIEPMTGAPLSGFKRVQFNMFLKKFASVDLLANITTGIFPILWVEEGILSPDLDLLTTVLMFHRAIRFSNFFFWALLIFGTCSITRSLYLDSGRKIEPATWTGQRSNRRSNNRC